jgi:hypothetical protein
MSVVRWVLAVIAALCLVGLIAFARNDPGVDDRDGDPEDVVATQTTDTPDLTVAPETTG